MGVSISSLRNAIPRFPHRPNAVVGELSMPSRVLLDLGSDPSFHTIYGYVIGLLLALVGIKYQGLNTSPFNQHPVIMILFLVSITVYVMALFVSRSNQIHSILLVWICLLHISGSVACELLLLLLVSSIWCFIINLSSLVLVLSSLFCSKYLIQPSQLADPQGVEGQATEITDLEAAVTSST